MAHNELFSAISKVADWCNSSDLSYALIGGLAVSFRTIERATRDIDLAVLTKEDQEAEALVRSMQNIGFKAVELAQIRGSTQISNVRMLSAEFPGIYLDLLIGMTGIEAEIVAGATKIEVSSGIVLPVATIPALIAMKVLSSAHKGRRRDIFDLENLILEASNEELKQAEGLVSLIVKRGRNQGEDLNSRLSQLIVELRPTPNNM